MFRNSIKCTLLNRPSFYLIHLLLGRGKIKNKTVVVLKRSVIEAALLKIEVYVEKETRSGVF